MSAATDRVVRLGEVTGVYGVKGWVKVHSYTEPKANLIHYPSWLLQTAAGHSEVAVEDAKVSGKQLIAKLAGYDDRDAAFGLVGAAIGVHRSALPPCGPGEYYWTDLEGLKVESTAGIELGCVLRLIATGANDVLVLDRGERMIPFVSGEIVESVDLEAGVIIVNWDETYWE